MYNKIVIQSLLLSLFIHGFTSTLFSFRTTLFIFWIYSFYVLRTFKLIESSPELNLVQSYRTIVPQNILVFYHPSCASIMSQLLSLTIIYFILGVRSGSITLLVPMSSNFRPPSHQSILCLFHFYPFLTKCIILEICLVCLISLPFLAMHIADVLFKTIKGYFSGNMAGSLFNNS